GTRPAAGAPPPAGARPSSPGTARPGAAVPPMARPVAPTMKMPAVPAPQEEELADFFEETTTEIERAAVRDAIASGEVQPPTQDPWGLRSQARFRSLGEDEEISPETDQSGFAYVNESGKATLGPPPPTGRTSNIPRASRPTEGTPRPQPPPRPAPPPPPKAEGPTPRTLALDDLDSFLSGSDDDNKG
ncbi:MAG: hypothetical protein AB2A00_31840, partial [Myxococcota bacterium]